MGTSFAELATYLGDEDVKEPTELELDSHLLGLLDALDSLHSLHVLHFLHVLHLLHVLHSLHSLHALHFPGADRALRDAAEVPDAIRGHLPRGKGCRGGVGG